jgi:hypothetical protein
LLSLKQKYINKKGSKKKFKWKTDTL